MRGRWRTPGRELEPEGDEREHQRGFEQIDAGGNERF